MPPRTSFEHLIVEAGLLAENERNRIADGVEGDEHLVLQVEDYSDGDEFRQAVVAEIMRLLAL